MLLQTLAALTLAGPANAAATPDWDLAGFWTSPQGGGVLALRVRGDGTVRCGRADAKLGVLHQVCEATREGKSLNMTVYASYDDYKAKRVAWRLGDVRRDGKQLRGRLTVGTKDRPVTLGRWDAVKVKVLPGDALKRALSRWKTLGKPAPDMGDVGLSEMGQYLPREWWVRIPREPRKPGRVTSPSHLTIAVDVATGALRGPFGR